MSLLQTIDADIKTAMIAGEKITVDTLKSVKNALLYASVAGGSRGEEASDEQVVTALSKEAKKRSEAIELYQRVNAADKAAKEKAELAIIEKYLPAKLTEEELIAYIDEVINSIGALSPQDMGKVIAHVKQSASSGQIDGAMLASLVKQKLLTQ